nr:hypothetical protein [Tanacetum cinerariifolium]
MEGPSEPIEDDSPAEKVKPVKAKRKYTRRRQRLKKSDIEFVEPWTIEEEIALCKTWVSMSENNIEGNGKKASGFWTEVTEFFHKEMGEQKRSYDSVNYKWKNRIRPKKVGCRAGSLPIYKTLPVSKLGCVLCQDIVAFCLEDALRFACSSLRFVSGIVVFCLQARCVLPTVEDLFLRFSKGKLWQLNLTKTG